MKKTDVQLLSRREATRGILVTIGGAVLFACGESSSSTPNATTPTGEGDAGSGSTDTDAGTNSTSDWASGGTKSMTAAASYPDPFTTALTTCVLATTATEGPCTEAADQARKDVSEGYTGLPVRLALKVVDAACKPIAGAKVKIWHTSIAGSYSGDTPNNGMCLKDQADSAKHYFRGAQTSDTDGRVDFDTCFPGWYPGRAIHIHFTVSLNGKSYTSQLVFEQSLVAEIFSSHVEYKSYGQPDTSNASDNVVGGGDLASFTLATARMTDGAMLASKVLVVSV